MSARLSSPARPCRPRLLLEKLKNHLLDSRGQLGGDPAGLKKLLGEVVSEEEVWDCTTCGACMEVCPMLNEHIAKIMGMRQFGVLMESRFPEEFQTLYRGLENQGNPWGINADTRSDWAKDLQIPLIGEKGETDILFWVGCAGSFDQHSQGIARSFVKILQRAGADFAFLGNEEKCCGDPARRSGMEYLFQIQARQNIETLNRYKFRRIVTICPHGLHALKNEYARMGGNYRVLHHSELLHELLAQGKIRVAARQQRKNHLPRSLLPRAATTIFMKSRGNCWKNLTAGGRWKWRPAKKPASAAAPAAAACGRKRRPASASAIAGSSRRKRPGPTPSSPPALTVPSCSMTPWPRPGARR